MYQGTSELFNELIKAPSRTFKARLVGETEIIDKGFRTLKVNLLSNENKNTLSIGGITASELEVEIDGLSGVVTGKEFDVQIGLLTDFENKVYEWVSIGKFTAQKPTTRAYTTKFTAYDRFVSKLGGLYLSSLTYPATGKAILDEISALSGVPIKTDGITALNFPMRTTLGDNGETTQVNPFDGFTYRETIGYIAMAYGKFATVNRNGEVELRWYTDNGYRIEKNMSYDDIEVAQTEFSVDYLNVIVNNDRNNPIQKGEGVTGVTVGSPIFTEEMLNYAYGQISGFKYLPTTLSFKGDPRIDLGDIVTVVKSDGIEIKVPIMSLDFDFDGGLVCKVGSYGDTEQSNNTYASNPNSQRYNRLYTVILLLNQAIANKVTAEYVEARYVSTANLDAIQADITQAVIRDLETEFLTADEADIKYANIELSNIAVADVGRLFADVGLITDLVVVDGHITGVLDSVTINANNITSGTLTTDRLVIRGTDKSIVYELNNIDGALQAKEVDTLNGEIITPRTINADRIVANTITSSELNADEIFANSAIIKKIFSEDVEATGTITGVKLVGAEAEIKKGTIGGWSIDDTTLTGGNVTLNSDGTITSFGTNNEIIFGSGQDYTLGANWQWSESGNVEVDIASIEFKAGHLVLNDLITLTGEGFRYDDGTVSNKILQFNPNGIYSNKINAEIVNAKMSMATTELNATKAYIGPDGLTSSGNILIQGANLKLVKTLPSTTADIECEGVITANDVNVPLLADNTGDTYMPTPIAGALKANNNRLPDSLPTMKSFMGSYYGKSGSGTSNTWYNVISSRHNNGINDGSKYGMYLYSNMTASGVNLAWNKQTNGTWQGERNILDNVNCGDYAVPKTGGSMTGALDISSSSFPMINLTRLDSSWTAGIKFNNNLGVLGAFGMAEVNGSLIRYASDISTKYDILDTGNYSSYTAPLKKGTATGTSFSITFNKYSSYILSLYNSTDMAAMYSILGLNSGSFRLNVLDNSGSFTTSLSGTTLTISGSGLSSSNVYTYKMIELK